MSLVSNQNFNLLIRRILIKALLFLIVYLLLLIFLHFFVYYPVYILGLDLNDIYFDFSIGNNMYNEWIRSDYFSHLINWLSRMLSFNFDDGTIFRESVNDLINERFSILFIIMFIILSLTTIIFVLALNMKIRQNYIRRNKNLNNLFQRISFLGLLIGLPFLLGFDEPLILFFRSFGIEITYSRQSINCALGNCDPIGLFIDQIVHLLYPGLIIFITLLGWTMFFSFSDLGRVIAEFKLEKEAKNSLYEKKVLFRKIKLIWIFHLSVYPLFMFQYPSIVGLATTAFLLQDVIILQASLFILISFYFLILFITEIVFEIGWFIIISLEKKKDYPFIEIPIKKQKINEKKYKKSLILHLLAIFLLIFGSALIPIFAGSSPNLSGQFEKVAGPFLPGENPLFPPKPTVLFNEPGSFDNQENWEVGEYSRNLEFFFNPETMNIDTILNINRTDHTAVEVGIIDSKGIIKFDESKASDVDAYGVFLNTSIEWIKPEKIPDEAIIEFNLDVNTSFSSLLLELELKTENGTSLPNIPFKTSINNGSRKVSLYLSNFLMDRYFSNSSIIDLNFLFTISDFNKTGLGTRNLSMEIDNLQLIFGPSSYGLLGTDNQGQDRWSILIYSTSNDINNAFELSLIITTLAIFFSILLSILPKKIDFLTKSIPGIFWRIPIIFISINFAGRLIFKLEDHGIFEAFLMIFIYIIYYLAFSVIAVTMIEPKFRIFFDEIRYKRSVNYLLVIESFIVILKAFLIHFGIITMILFFIELFGFGNPFENSLGSMYQNTIITGLIFNSSWEGLFYGIFPILFTLILIIVIPIFLGSRKLLQNEDQYEKISGDETLSTEA